MRVVITGAGGFVGAHLIPEMSSAHHELVLTSKHPVEGFPWIVSQPLEVTDREALKGFFAAQPADAVIHLAGQASVPVSWKDPASTYATNIIGTSNLLEALKDRPETRVLLIGTGQEYGPVTTDRPIAEDHKVDPSSPYAISKVAAGQMGLLYLLEFGLQVIRTRSFNHTGPGQGPTYSVGAFCQQIVEIERGERDKVLRVGHLGARRDFLDVRDVVTAYRLLIESGSAGEIYNVSSGEGTSIKQILDLLLEIAGLSGDVEVIEEAEPRPGDPQLLVGDPSKLKAAVGWSPRISLEQSLRDTLDWYRIQNANGPAWRTEIK